MMNMKPSGVQWIGDVPSEWKLGKVKNRFYSTKTIVGDKVDDYERLALTLGGVIRRSKEANDGLQPEKFDGYQILKENELVFKLIDLANVSTSRVGLSPYTGIVSPAYIVLHDRQNGCPRYAEYYFLSMWMHEVFNHLGGDGVRSSLNAKDLLNVPFPLISEAEQQAIADFLDDRCSKIDEIIAEATASIEEYKELKQAVIFEAVTKGINFTGKTKQSGIFWAQDIPETWDVIKVARSFSVELGKMLDAKRVSGERLRPYLRNADVQWYGINTDNLNVMDFSEEEDERYTVKPGDLLVCEGGDIGKSFIVPEDFPEGIYYQKALHRVRSYDNDSDSLKWLYYILYVMSKYGFFNALSGEKSTIQHLPAVTFNQIKFPMPKSEEKGTIVDYLEKQIPEYDSLISEKQALIDDLQAYKKSLIYEVVTGKRRVV